MNVVSHLEHSAKAKKFIELQEKRVENLKRSLAMAEKNLFTMVPIIHSEIRSAEALIEFAKIFL